MKKTYLTFIITGYESTDPANQFHQEILLDSTSIELIDTSAERALARAAQLLKKSHYRVSSIFEKFYGIS